MIKSIIKSLKSLRLNIKMAALVADLTHSCQDILITKQKETFSGHVSQGVTDAEKATFDELSVLITESV